MPQRIILALLLAPMLMGCANIGSNDTDPTQITELASCPASPNCVCSADSERSHYIEPLQLRGDTEVAWQKLLDILREDDSISIVTSTEHYIRAAATTRLFRFTDDVEFLLRREQGVIDMRSASRLGFYDLGKNRSRLEAIRNAMRAADKI